MNLNEIMTGGGITLFVLFTLIQIAPIKINPWSSLARFLGKAINADVLKDLEEVKDHQLETQKRLDKHIEEDDRREMDAKRQRILRFNSEIMDNKNFTHEYFCDMLVEIDEYEKYCESHPGYRNSRANLAIQNIVRVCEEHERNNDFLK